MDLVSLRDFSFINEAVEFLSEFFPFPTAFVSVPTTACRFDVDTIEEMTEGVPRNFSLFSTAFVLFFNFFGDKSMYVVIVAGADVVACLGSS